MIAVLVPATPHFGNRVALIFGGKPSPDEEVATLASGPDVVIIGFGPVDQIAAQSLVDRDCRVSVADLNRDGVRRAKQLGFQAAIGDATQIDVLEHAHIAQAHAVVITIPHHHSAMTILEQVRQLAPQAHVVVRSRYQMHTNDFVTAGSHAVVGDEEQVGKSLADHLRQWLDTHGEGENDRLDSETD